MIGHTRGEHCIFWPAQNEWCYSGGIENWLIISLKNKQGNKRKNKRQWRKRKEKECETLENRL